MKRIILKFGCLLLLAFGIFAFTGDAKAEAASCGYVCPEGTICQGFGENAECVCVCFDAQGYCTYSWSNCPNSPWVRK